MKNTCSKSSKIFCMVTTVALVIIVLSGVFCCLKKPEYKSSIILYTAHYIEDMPLKLKDGYGNHINYQLDFAIPVTILNNGSKPVSLINYELFYEGETMEDISKNSFMTVKDQDYDQGFFLDFRDSILITMPIYLQPYEGKTLFFKTSIANISGLGIVETLDSGSTLRDLQIAIIKTEKVIGGSSVDLFGNELDFAIGARGILGYDLANEDSIRVPVYILKIGMSDGEIFGVEFTPYETLSSDISIIPASEHDVCVPRKKREYTTILEAEY
jgi:hypothetical protein